MREPLFCGASKKNITPSADLLPDLRGLMGARFATVADQLYVRVLALKAADATALFIGFDLDKAPNPASGMEEISRRFCVPKENITYYGIHAHSTPVTGRRANEAHNNVYSMGENVQNATSQYEEFVQTRMLEAVEEALKQMQPALLDSAFEPCAININRNLVSAELHEDGSFTQSLGGGHNPLGPADHNVYVLRLTDIQGKILALAVNYAMHNTLMFMNNYDGNGGMAVSSDVGGMVSAALEKRFPGSVVLWCSGAAGDVAPLPPPVHLPHDLHETEASRQYLEKRVSLEALTANHYAAVMKALDKMAEGSREHYIACDVDYTETPARKVVREGFGPRVKITISEPDGLPPYRIRVHMVRIDNLLLLGIGGELYTKHAMAIRASLPEGYHSIIINHDASMLADAGYILDDETWNEAEKSIGKGRGIPGAPAAFKAGYVEGALITCVENLIKKTEDVNI